MALRKGWSRAPACFAVAAVLMLLIDMPGALADEQQPVIEINNGNLDIMLPETREARIKQGNGVASPLVHEEKLKDTLLPMQGRMVAAEVAANTSRDRIEQNGAAIGGLNASLAESRAVQGQHAQALGEHNRTIYEQGLQVGHNEKEIFRVDREVSCTKENRDELSQAIVDAFASVNSSSLLRAQACEVREAALEAQVEVLKALVANATTTETASTGGGTSDGASSALFGIAAALVAGCDEDGCAAEGEHDVTVYARGVFFTDADIYKCVFTDKITGLVMRTAAKCTFNSGNVGDTFKFSCKTPIYTPEYIDREMWSVWVAVEEGGQKIPYAYAHGAIGPSMDFKVVGPTISLIEDLTVSWKSLTSSYQLTIDFFVEDDSDAISTSVEVSGGLDNTKASLTGSSKSLSLTLQFPSPSAVTADVVANVSLTAADLNNLTFVREFQVNLLVNGDALIFTLDSTDNTIRDYSDNAFWESTDLVINGDISVHNYLSSNGDIRTKAFTMYPLGERVKLVAHIGSTVVGEAYYIVNPAYRESTFLSLMAGGNNVDFAVKDVASSWANVATSFLANGNGNSTEPVFKLTACVDQEVGDLFLHFNDGLRAKVDGWAGANRFNRFRLGTNRNVNGNPGPHIGNAGCHVYAGIGGDHFCNDWCARFEMAPIIGYCGLFNTYGNIKPDKHAGCLQVSTQCKEFPGHSAERFVAMKYSFFINV